MKTKEASGIQLGHAEQYNLHEPRLMKDVVRWMGTGSSDGPRATLLTAHESPRVWREKTTT